MRFVYWMSLCIAGGLGAVLFDRAAGARNWTAKPWMAALWQSLGATLMVSLILLGYTLVTYGWPGWVHMFTLPFFVWVISIVICGIGELSRSRKDIPPVQDTRPRIFERLKPSLRNAEIHALCSEDHYVRVLTSSGEELLLMRLSDAIAETAPLKGLQTHRSWWIAEAGVEAVRKQDGKLSITLKGGTAAPVSRNKAKTVREAGWV